MAEAVSEQALADRAMQHVPGGSVIVGVRNFGIFATAYGAQKAGQKCIVRLTAVRAKSLMGGSIAREGDYSVCWRASRWDGRKKGNPQAAPWPAGASVEGRLIVVRVGRGKKKQWLYLFTTTSLAREEVVRLYGLRWRIETDLRSLKQTVHLSHIQAHSTDILEKRTVGCRDGVQPCACHHVPSSATCADRASATELHLRLQHCARQLSRSVGCTDTPSARKETGSDDRPGGAMPTPEPDQAPFLSSCSLGPRVPLPYTTREGKLSGIGLKGRPTTESTPTARQSVQGRCKPCTAVDLKRLSRVGPHARMRHGPVHGVTPS